MGPLLEKLLGTLKPEQVCWACLFIAVAGILFGMRTYATDNDFQRFAMRAIEESMMSNRRSQCDAIAAQNKTASELYFTRIQQLQRDYEDLAGHRFSIPACGDM